MIDPGFDGPRYTWEKNNLFERLDRMLVNEAWTTTFATTRVTHLPRICSDHGPLLMRCSLTDEPRRGGSPFRFQNMWTRHQGFQHLVRESWSQETGATGLLSLEIKLKRLKATLKIWNRNTLVISSPTSKRLRKLLLRRKQNSKRTQLAITELRRIGLLRNTSSYLRWRKITGGRKQRCDGSWRVIETPNSIIVGLNKRGLNPGYMPSNAEIELYVRLRKYDPRRWLSSKTSSPHQIALYNNQTLILLRGSQKTLIAMPSPPRQI